MDEFLSKETHSCPTIAALTYGTRQCSNALEHATREVAEYGYCLREEVAGRMAISQKRRNGGSPTPLGHLGLTFSRAWVCFCSMCVWNGYLGLLEGRCGLKCVREFAHINGLVLCVVVWLKPQSL